MAKIENITSPAARVHTEVIRAVNDVLSRHPDAKHNQGRQILETYLWDEIVKLATGKSNDSWDRMEKNQVYVPPDGRPGKFECGESPHFLIKASVSEPVKRFSEEELAKVLEASSFHIPPHMTKGFVAAAKVPGKPQTRLKIEER